MRWSIIPMYFLYVRLRYRHRLNFVFFSVQVEAAQALREIYLCSLSEDVQTLLERAWEVKGDREKVKREEDSERKPGGKRMKGSLVSSSLFGDDLEDMEEDSEGVEVDVSVEGDWSFSW